MGVTRLVSARGGGLGGLSPLAGGNFLNCCLPIQISVAPIKNPPLCSYLPRRNALRSTTDLDS